MSGRGWQIRCTPSEMLLVEFGAHGAAKPFVAVAPRRQDLIDDLRRARARV